MIVKYIILALVIFTTCLAFQNNVEEWNDNNVNKELQKHENTLLLLYKSENHRYQHLADEYEKAVELLKNNDPPIFLAKVDCSGAGKDTCYKYEYSGNPTFVIFNEDSVIKRSHFDSAIETSQQIAEFVKKNNKPSLKELQTVDDMNAFLNTDDISAIGFFENDNTALSITFRKVAGYLRQMVRFANTSSKVLLDKEGQKNAVVIYRPKILQNEFEPGKVTFPYESGSPVQELIAFIKNVYKGLVGVRTHKNKYTEFKNPLVVTYYDAENEDEDNKVNYWRAVLAKIAKEFPEYNFAISSMNEFSDELNSYGISTLNKTPVVIVFDEDDRKFVLQDNFSVENFEKFMKDARSHKLEYYIKSEAIPKNNSGSVKIAVAKNFDQVVTTNGKDTLIMFYAHWGGHCKALTPIFQKLGDKLINEEIEIVKFNGALNDIPKPYDVSGFPTLYWAPKNDKNSPVKYEGPRQLDDLINYIAKYATEPLKGYSRNGKPIHSRETDL